MNLRLVCLRCNVDLRRFGVADIVRRNIDPADDRYLTAEAHLFLCPECGVIEMFHPQIGIGARYGVHAEEVEESLDAGDRSNAPDGWVCLCGYANDPLAPECANCGKAWTRDNQGRFDP